MLFCGEFKKAAVYLVELTSITGYTLNLRLCHNLQNPRTYSLLRSRPLANIFVYRYLIKGGSLGRPFHCSSARSAACFRRSSSCSGLNSCRMEAHYMLVLLNFAFPCIIFHFTFYGTCISSCILRLLVYCKILTYKILNIPVPLAVLYTVTYWYFDY